MKLSKKKNLAAKVLGVGKGRIIFVESALNEIKEAITRQDILDLHKNKAIVIRDKKGRKAIEKRKHRRGIGKCRKKVLEEKRKYIALTRKLRKTSKWMLNTKKINSEKYKKIRTMIKASKFKNNRHLLESLGEI